MDAVTFATDFDRIHFQPEINFPNNIMVKAITHEDGAVALFIDYELQYRKGLDLLWMGRFPNSKNRRFEDQIEAFLYSIPGLTIGKIFTPLWIPKEFP